jgi:hypothetical protein
VVADQRLRDAEPIDEVADAELFAGEQVHDPPAQGVGDGAQRSVGLRNYINGH